MEHIGGVGCLLVPRFPLACELADRPDLGLRPVVVAHPHASTVWIPSPSAERLGIRGNLSLKEAQERCPTLIVFDARPTHYAEMTRRMVAKMERALPVVEPIPDTAGAYLDLNGIAWFPTSSELHAALLACVPPHLGARLGVATSKFVARVAAEEAEAGKVVIVDSSTACEFLASRSVDLLALSAETLRRLHVMSIHTIGELARLPRQALLTQFGAEGAHAWEFARGIDLDPVRAQPWLPRVIEQISFGSPLISREAVMATLEQALIRCLRHPHFRERSARTLHVRLEMENQQHWGREIALKEATADRQKLWSGICSLMSSANVSGAVIAVTLELAHLAPQRGWQVELLPTEKLRAERLEESLRLLKSRFGHCPVSRLVGVEPWSRVPERRLALIDFDP